VSPPNHDHTLPVLPRAALHPGDGTPLSEFTDLLSPFSADPRRHRPGGAGLAAAAQPYGFLQRPPAGGGGGGAGAAQGAPPGTSL
jgi:hypothetical protein